MRENRDAADIYTKANKPGMLLRPDEVAQLVMPLIDKAGSKKAVRLLILEIRRAVSATDHEGHFVLFPIPGTKEDPDVPEDSYYCFGKTNSLPGRSWSLGRQPEFVEGRRGSLYRPQEVVVDFGGQVSRVHTKFEPNHPGKGLRIIDTSSNGTYVCIKPRGSEFSPHALIDNESHEIVEPEIFSVRVPTWLQYLERKLAALKEQQRLAEAARPWQEKFWDTKLGEIIKGLINSRREKQKKLTDGKN